MQGKKKSSDLIQPLLCRLQNRNLDLSKLVGIVTDGAPSMTGSKNFTLSLIYNQMHELVVQNELMQYHCVSQIYKT
jgi:hypothetical protein